MLPGTMQAFTDAPIYARTNGYLKRRLADIGAHVSAGQLLAEIDTPELDQQLVAGARRPRTADANARLALTTAERYRDLIKTDSVSRAGSRQRQRQSRGAPDGGRVRACERQAPRAAGGIPPHRSAVRRRRSRRATPKSARSSIPAATRRSCSTSPPFTSCACSSTSRRSTRARRSRACRRTLTLKEFPGRTVHRHARADGAVHRRRVAARCWRRSTSTTRKANCCRVRTRRCTSSCRRRRQR